MPKVDVSFRDPGLWGPPTWALLLDAAAAADDDHEIYRSPRTFLAVLEALRVLIPCKECRDSYGPFLDSLGDYADDYVGEQDAVALVWELKDMVNRKLGEDLVPLDEVQESLWDHRRSREDDRDLLLAVMNAEADTRAPDDPYYEILKQIWPQWMALVDTRADLPRWRGMQSRRQ
jgi:hypothetical protein